MIEGTGPVYNYLNWTKVMCDKELKRISIGLGVGNYLYLKDNKLNWARLYNNKFLFQISS